jgi:hypothetical protein
MEEKTQEEKMREIIEKCKTNHLEVQIILQEIKETAKAISQIDTSLKNLDSLRLKEEEKDKTSYLRFRSFFLASQTEGQSFFLFDETKERGNGIFNMSETGRFLIQLLPHKRGKIEICLNIEDFFLLNDEGTEFKENYLSDMYNLYLKTFKRTNYPSYLYPALIQTKNPNKNAVLSLNSIPSDRRSRKDLLNLIRWLYDLQLASATKVKVLGVNYSNSSLKDCYKN